jgi:hypothetical protein
VPLLVFLLAILVTVSDSFTLANDCQQLVLVAPLTLADENTFLLRVLEDKSSFKRNFDNNQGRLELKLFKSLGCPYVGLETLVAREYNPTVFLGILT